MIVVAFAGCGSLNRESLDEVTDGETIAEQAHGYPWREDYGIREMPVFRNPFYVPPARYIHYERWSDNWLSFEEMTVMAEKIIVAMGLEVENVSSTRDLTWFEGATVTAEGVEVTIGENGFVQVHFPDGFALPEGIMFSWEHPQDEAIAYLTERFSYALGLEWPDFGNGADSMIDQMLDYHFNTVRFIPNQDGELRWIDRPAPPGMVLSDKVGYFPIITPNEAIERMLEGQGSFGVDMGQPRPTVSDVVDIRLVYFGHTLGRNFLEDFAPWYHFVIRTPDIDYDQAYFVPAIRSDYLEANPAWAVHPHQ